MREDEGPILGCLSDCIAATCPAEPAESKKSPQNKKLLAVLGWNGFPFLEKQL